MSISELRGILLKAAEVQPVLNQEKILEYYESVVRENEVQNLTRLISPVDFYEGHILDVLELLKTECTDFPAMDLGSGAGVPGLLAGIMTTSKWVLVESEKRKANYLERAVTSLGLGSQLSVYPGRAEDYLRGARSPKAFRVGSIVARAVGSVHRIYSWIRECSTWNSLVLFKGPGWDEEWQEFQGSKFKDELIVVLDHAYKVGALEKARRIVKLSRKPSRIHSRVGI